MSDSSKKVKNVGNYLHPNHMELQSVFSKIKTLQELNKFMLPLLGEGMAKYCQVANLVEGRLILLAANGSIATQIRFMTPDLLKKMKTFPALADIQDILCKVAPSQAISPSKSKSTPTALAPLSAETAHMVQEIADNITDPDLKRIMQKIAAHTETTK